MYIHEDQSMLTVMEWWEVRVSAVGLLAMRLVNAFPSSLFGVSKKQLRRHPDE